LTFRLTGTNAEYKVAHTTVPIVRLATSLADKLITLIGSLEPIRVDANNKDMDLFDADKVIEFFKNFVSINMTAFREKISLINVNQYKGGFPYEIASHKSERHEKMENSHAIARCDNNLPITSFFGVFDGHGGPRVSEYVSLHLGAAIAAQPSFELNISGAMKRAYLETDSLVCQKIRRDVSRQVLILESERWINCGDSYN
jgi:hypothetical protein